MNTIDDQELHLPPSFLKALGAGETLAVTHDSAVVAFVIPAKPSSSKRPYGLAKGEFTVPPDFNEPLPDIEESIYDF
jgi:antitoxin (DNA-binding transcriptional repressor) of toxin-antitoxin stability system